MTKLITFALTAASALCAFFGPNDWFALPSVVGIGLWFAAFDERKRNISITIGFAVIGTLLVFYELVLISVSVTVAMSVITGFQFTSLRETKHRRKLLPILTLLLSACSLVLVLTDSILWGTGVGFFTFLITVCWLFWFEFLLGLGYMLLSLAILFTLNGFAQTIEEPEAMNTFYLCIVYALLFAPSIATLFTREKS